MALLDDEIAKKKAEDALLGVDSKDDESDDESDVSTDLPEETPETSEEDKPSSPEVYQPKTKAGPSYVLVPLNAPKLDTKTDEQVTGSALDLTDPNQLGATKLDTKTDEQVTAPPLDKGEAPAALDQVERATLVKPPAPDMGERGAPIPAAASVETPDLSTDLPEDVSPVVGGTAQPEVRRAALAGETPVALPPEPVVRGAQVGVTPKAQPVTSPAAAPTTPATRQTSLGLTPDEYKSQYVNPPTGTAAQPSVATADAGGLNINTDYTADSNSSAKGRGGDGQVHGIVLHSTDAGEKSSLETLTHGGVSAHYMVTEDGRIYNLVPDGDTAYHAGKTTGQYAGYDNSNTIGIEQVHIDGQPWAPAQVAATARLVAYLKNKHGVVDDGILGHSDVAPGRKQDPLNYPWKGFFAAVDSSTGAAQPTGASGGKTGQQAGVGPSITGKATTFGYNDPQDSGVGAPKLGQLDTNNRDLIGIAVPEEALRAYVGAHPQSWRTARVQVTGANGQQVMVPIVDMGPRDTSDARGVVADFTQGLTDLTGNKGDQNFGFRIIPNAGPDVMKDPQAFADEQAAIKAGINTGARFQQQTAAVKKPSYVLQPMALASPQQEQVNQFERQGQIDNLSILSDQTSNPVALYRRLDSDVEGVTPAMRQQFQANLKPQVISLMKQSDPSLSDDQAWAKAQTDPNALDVGVDFWNKFVGSFQQLQPLLQQATGPSVEQSHLDSFLSQALPNGSDKDKHALLTKLYALPPDQRGDAVSKLIPNPQVGVPGQDPQQVVSALDRLSDPNYLKTQANQAAKAQADLKQRMATDPRIAGSPAAFASENLAQIPEMLAAASIPPLMAAQVSQQVRDQMREQHPEYSQEELDQKAAYSTLVQFVGQEAASKLFTAGAGALLNGVKSPVQRAIAQALISTGSGAAIMGGAQAGSNIVTGEPIGQGVPGALASGAIMGHVTGVAHGVGELRPAPPVESSPVQALAENVPGDVRTKFGDVNPPVGPPEHIGPPAPTSFPVRSEDVTGPNAPDVSVPWYRPGPLVTQAEEPQTFSPAQLARAVQTLPQGATPEQIRQAAANLRPEADFTRRTVAFQQPELGQHDAGSTTGPSGASIRGAEPQTMASGGRVNVTPPEAPPETTPPQPVQLGRTREPAVEPVVPRPVTPHVVDPANGQPRVSESEPWVSKIANRFTAERMTSGDLGPVEPGVGVTKEEMIARGLKMGPETISQHVSNIMNDVGGNPRDQAAAIRTEEARLSQVSRQASLASEADPGNQQLRVAADNAFKDVTDFNNGPVAKLKNNWHAQGMTLQGEIPVDLSTYNGLRDAYLRDVGKPPPANAEPVLRRTAQRVRDAATAETAAMNKLGAEIEKQSAIRRLPTPDQVQENIMKRMKDIPCPI